MGGRFGAYLEEVEPNSKAKGPTWMFDSRQQSSSPDGSSDGNRSLIVRLRVASWRSWPARHNRCAGHLTSTPHHTILVPGHPHPSVTEKTCSLLSHLPFSRSPELTWTNVFAHRSSPRTPSTPSSTTSSFAPITSAAAPHLALFQSLSDHIRSEPEFVIERITEWLCASDSPRTWAILALCLRATAHESVDANRAARDDYGRVLTLWEDLLNDLGSDKIRRWKVNMQFALSRFRALGGDTDSTFSLPLR